MPPANAVSRAQASRTDTLALYLRLMRVRQWVKSGFVIAPLIFSISFPFPDRVGRNLFAALIFSLASSAIYVFNDLFDRDADRCHPDKNTRPVAAGLVSVAEARWLVAVLAAAVSCGLLVLPVIAPAILAYLFVATVYTLWLKHWVWWDMAALTLAFVIRVETGILAIGVPASPWMLSATAFLAFYLVSVKRREELRRVGNQARSCLTRYSAAQLDGAKLLGAMAAASSYAVFAATVRPVLIPTIGFVIIGIVRFEWRTREAGGESAADVVLRDPVLAVCVLLWAISAAAALVLLSNG